MNTPIMFGDVIIFAFVFKITISVYHMQGAGTTESTLTEIFASRSNRQINAISEAYLAGLYHLSVSLISADQIVTEIIAQEMIRLS